MKMRIAKWGVYALAVVVLAGCAGGGGSSGPSDEDVIRSIVSDAMAALQAGDIETMVSGYAEDFTSDQGGGVAETKEFLQGAKDQGFLDDIEISLDNLEISIDGDKATAEPIELEGAFGALTLSLEFAKRDGAWLVVYQSQY